MPHYRIAGQEIYFSCSVSEIETMKIAGRKNITSAFPSSVSPGLVCWVDGFVGGEKQRVEVSFFQTGCLLKLDGGNEAFVTRNGGEILCRKRTGRLSTLDRGFLSGPALVLALAFRKTFCLHASAAQFRGQVHIFLGESGQGKSTLAAYLSSAGGREWQRVADDILPVTASPSHPEAWPHYPQLKLPPESQPGMALPERIPIRAFILLRTVPAGAPPELQLLTGRQAVQTLVAHTAGARLFDPRLLADHLAFSSGTARLAPVYTLSYPRRWEVLPTVRELLQNSC